MKRRRTLTEPQVKALTDAKRGPLFHWSAGWGGNGGALHATGAIEALKRRRLLRINRLAGVSGVASITANGRQALTELTG